MWVSVFVCLVISKCITQYCSPHPLPPSHFLPPLLSQDTLVPTLARVLRDDGKLSTELCLALMRVLFCLSCFSQLHTLLVDNMVGSLTFDILDLEFKRTQRRQQVVCVFVFVCRLVL